jgi:hypothetical protein
MSDTISLPLEALDRIANALRPFAATFAQLLPNSDYTEIASLLPREVDVVLTLTVGDFHAAMRALKEADGVRP